MEWILLALFILILCLGAVLVYRIPIFLVISFTNTTTLQGFIAVGWGIVSIRISRTTGNWQNALCIRSSPLYRWENTGSPGETKEDNRLFNLLDMAGSVELLQHIPGWILRIIRHIRLGNATGHIRFGTGDPVATGLFYGVYRAVIPLFPNNCSFELSPVFERAECTGEVRVRVLIVTPLDLLVVIGFQALSIFLWSKLVPSPARTPGAAYA